MGICRCLCMHARACLGACLGAYLRACRFAGVRKLCVCYLGGLAVCESKEEVLGLVAGDAHAKHYRKARPKEG